MARINKVVKSNLKMVIPAGGATPAPPVGSILGAHGLPLMEFINAFNSQTSDRKGERVTVHVRVFEDKSFDFTVVGEEVSSLIKKKIGLKKGSAISNKDKVGKITKAQLTEIAESKLADFNTKDLESAKRMVAGSARAMGVEVVD